MMDIFAKLFKSGAILAALSAAFGQLFNIDFLTKLDLLNGFQGAWPHFVAIIFAILGWRAMVSRHATTSATDVKRSRARLTGWALGIFALLIFLIVLHLPERLGPAWGEPRWIAALVAYLTFYATLGASLA
jgi:hypothetical protein